MSRKQERADLEATGYDGLAKAIVIQAVKDYRLMLKRCEEDVKLERFFSSGWFALLCDLNGAKIVETLKDDFKRKKNKTKDYTKQ